MNSQNPQDHPPTDRIVDLHLQFQAATDDRQEHAEEWILDMLALKTRVTAIEMALRTNTQITTTIGQDTSELLEMFRSLKGGFKVMGWLGSFAKWVAAIGTAIAALYALIQSARGH